MRTLPAGLQAHLDSGATTLCWCWRLTRADGMRLGFTDHDRPVTFDGTTFEAATGFTASEIAEQVGLSVDNLEVSSALSAESLDEADLAAGLFDNASVEIFRVNWQSPDQRVLMRKGVLGEVKRSALGFAAEVRGLAHALQQPKGRVIQFACDADLGDARCTVDLGQAAYRGSGTVSAVRSARAFTASGLETFASGWFARGLVTWTSGANQGRRMEVKRHGLAGALAEIELWQPMGTQPAPGDTFDVTAGCDKQPATCRDKFANMVNFRGFPHIPGNDFVTAYPNSDDAGNDGTSLFAGGGGA